MKQLCFCTWMTSIGRQSVQNFIVWLKGPKTKHFFRWDLLCYTSILSISKVTLNQSNQHWHLPFYTVTYSLPLQRYIVTRSIDIHLVRWLTPYISTITISTVCTFGRCEQNNGIFIQVFIFYKKIFAFQDFQIILMQNAKGLPLPTALVM